MKHLPAVFLSMVAFVAPVSGGAPAPPKISPALQAAVSRAGDSGRVASWVFFADKGGSPALADVEASLTPHARARRARNRGLSRLVDAYDVPVDARYVEAVRRQGLRIRSTSRWLNAVSIDADAPAVAAVAELPFVRGMDVVRVGREPEPEPVEESAPLEPGQPGSGTSLNYGLSFTQNNQINVPALHDQGYSGNGVWIAMLDAGFNNLGHVAFQSMDILITHDFVNGDSLVSDGDVGSGSHGTWTLSTIGGYAPGDLIGPAYGATYLLAKTENTTWEHNVEEDAWVAGAEWADSIGADIISSSLGYSTFDVGQLSYTWNNMNGNTTIVTIGADIAASRGILVVNSAGNGGSVALPANTLGAPCDGDSVLAVGSVNSSGVRAASSSVGPTADGRIKPDVMAMGVSARMASESSTTGYTNHSGTSFACPLTAGAAALILEARPNASNQQIMDALRATASQAGAPDRLYGWGIIDAAAAAATIPTGVGDAPQPAGIVLHPAYPNPFNPTTTIEYEIPARAHVRLTVFDVSGAVVARLVDEAQSRGRKSVAWNARDHRGTPLASGVYLYRLEAAGAQQTRKMVLLK